jgi:nicotinamidase/pyrazinamidase
MEKIIAFGLIDAQRGFMPAEEGKRLDKLGFGELPIPNGEQIVPKVNALLGAFAAKQLPVFYTQDWHPAETAHFSDNPNFNTTWPVHCVQGTPGAQLHPEIEYGYGARQFLKGYDALKDGSDDTSYSGFNGYDFDNGIRPDQFLKNRHVTTLVLGGLALDYCVKATALDFRQKTDLEVIVITDATAPVTAETGFAAMNELVEAGVTFATTDDIVKKVNAVSDQIWQQFTDK